jgi:isopropylmalate/homocitrate/citramalate synthase
MQSVSNQHVSFYDTTLRDGEQMPDVAFNLEKRLRIAQALDQIGVDEIELGFASSGAAQQADMAEVVKSGLRARTLSLARPLKVDIDAAARTGVQGVIIFTSTSDIHLKYKLHKSLSEVLDTIEHAAAYASSLHLFVQVSIEDATRTPDERLREIANRVLRNGADRIGLADTVGIATPALIQQKVRAVLDITNVPVAVHCHNDFGLATANSLAAVEAGASVLSTTINGIGERAGNAATEECAVALKLLLGREISIDLTRLCEVSRLVAECARIAIPPNKAISGRNCFRHESGIHVAALLQDPQCYEPFDPAMVGAAREFVLGKTNGRAAIRYLSSLIGEEIDDETCNQVLYHLKDRAERGERCDSDMLKELIIICRKSSH